jgi:UDP-2,3-diacylglucosamine hydrolase
MKCAFFSDLHIKSVNDDASELFLKFCSSTEVIDSDTIFLLGDMFDMLIGEHEEYLIKYNYFFENIVNFLESGKKVVFLEGNHDFHLKKTINKYIKSNTTNYKLFRYLNDGENIVLNNKKYYFCHGDDVDYNNISFKRWKRVYTSIPFQIMVNHIFPYKLLEYLGHSASNDSKKRGRKTFDYHQAREKYINGAKNLIREKSVDGIISGHTHIFEIHTYEDKTQYINCGYPLKDKSYIHFNGIDFIQISLEDSSD